MPPKPRPLELSDQQMTDLFRYAASLHPDDRGPFLEAVAAKLRDQPEIGDGAVARTCRALLPGFLTMPRGEGHKPTRWSRRTRAWRA
jgi:hypothetical protein